MRRSHKILATCFIVVTLAHAVSGFVSSKIPAWKMFRQIPRFSYAIEDRFGKSIDVRDYIQKRGYIIGTARGPYEIAEWIAAREPHRLPIHGTITVWVDGEPKNVRFRFDPVRSADDSTPAPRLTSR